MSEALILRGLEKGVLGFRFEVGFSSLECLPSVQMVICVFSRSSVPASPGLSKITSDFPSLKPFFRQDIRLHEHKSVAVLLPDLRCTELSGEVNRKNTTLHRKSALIKSSGVSEGSEAANVCHNS